MVDIDAVVQLPCYYWHLSTVFRSGGTTNPHIATLELVQEQQIVYKFLYSRESYVSPASMFYGIIKKLRSIPFWQSRRSGSF